VLTVLVFLSPAIQAREFLSKLGDLSQTQIFAKIENVEVFSSWFLSFSLLAYVSLTSTHLLLCRA
jgi:hypothetical protein